MAKSISRKAVGVAAWLGSIALALEVGAAIGESVPPKESAGVKISAPVVMDLAPWAEDMKGRQLRIRRFDIAPGGVIGIHSHDDRPDVSYLVQGNLVERRSGGFAEPRASESLHAAGKGVTHWVENPGPTPAILIASIGEKRASEAPRTGA